MNWYATTEEIECNGYKKFYIENDKYGYISNGKLWLKENFEPKFCEVKKELLKKILETYKLDTEIIMELTLMLLE